MTYEKVQIQLPNCTGVTSFGNKNYAADKNGEVTIPSTTAEALKKSRVVASSRRLFGGFELPKPAPTT